MPKKKNYDTSFGCLRWIESLESNVEFATEEEYIEYIRDEDCERSNNDKGNYRIKTETG